MSMIMRLKQAPAATLDLLVERPELAVVFWTKPGPAASVQPAFVRWLVRLFGGKESRLELPEAPVGLARNGAECDLDEAWHALQWLLTKPRSTSEGDEWQVSPPEGTLLTAGRAIVGSDHGYGDDRAVGPECVAAFDVLLQATPWPRLEERFDPGAMDSADVYPSGWGGDDRGEWVRDGYHQLRSFVHETHGEALGLVVKLS